MECDNIAPPTWVSIAMCTPTHDIHIHPTYVRCRVGGGLSDMGIPKIDFAVLLFLDFTKSFLSDNVL